MGIRQRRSGWRARSLASAAGIAAVVLVGSAAASGSAAAANATSTLSFGAPTAASCAWVGSQQLNDPLSPIYALGLPPDAWDGVPLLGLLVRSIAQQDQDGLGPSCGDLTHGSSQVGIGGSVRTSFSQSAGGAIGVTTSGQTAATNPLTALLHTTVAANAIADESAVVPPQSTTGAQSLTITATYTILSAGAVTNDTNPGFSANQSFAEVGLNPPTIAAFPTCNGQTVLPVESGPSQAQTPGTYSATFVFACPAGQTLADPSAVTVQFTVTQAAEIQAGPTAASLSGSIVAEPGSVSVAVGS